MRLNFNRNLFSILNFINYKTFSKSIINSIKSNFYIFQFFIFSNFFIFVKFTRIITKFKFKKTLNRKIHKKWAALMIIILWGNKRTTNWQPSEIKIMTKLILGMMMEYSLNLLYKGKMEDKMSKSFLNEKTWVGVLISINQVDYIHL